MTARDLIIRESAMQQTLSFVNRSLATLERRLRWPGSLRFAQDASTALTQGVTSTLVSLTLEPGSWWVLAGTQVDTYSGGSIYSLTLDMSGVTSAGIKVGGASEPIVGDQDSMTIVGYSSLSTTTVVDLDLLWVTSTPTSGAASSSYIIAVPV